MVDLRYAILRNTARIRRKLFGFPAEHEVAEETIVVHPADEAETSEAIALPGEIERATAAIPSSTMVDQRRLAKHGVLQHEKTTLYRLKNAYIAGAAVYAASFFKQYGKVRSANISSNTDFISEGLLCESGGAAFFGHWLCDNLCTELLAPEIGKPPLSLPPHWMHEAGYRDIVGFHPTQTPIMFVKNLWLIDDRGYNAGRIARYRHLRNLVRRGSEGAKSDLVYIARGSTGATRNLVNDQEIRRVLSQNGFTVLEPERSAPQHVVDVLSCAALVVSVEGSAICHALLSLPPGAGMVIIQPPDHFNIFNKVIGDFSHLRTGFVVAKPNSDGFSLDPTRLLKTIDLVLKAIN